MTRAVSSQRDTKKSTSQQFLRMQSGRWRSGDTQTHAERGRREVGHAGQKKKKSSIWRGWQ